jgi:hypothetical protein
VATFGALWQLAGNGRVTTKDLDFIGNHRDLIGIIMGFSGIIMG